MPITGEDALEDLRDMEGDDDQALRVLLRSPGAFTG